jgi:hypothetical protein
LRGSEKFVEVIEDVSETWQNHVNSSKPQNLRKPLRTLEELHLYLTIDKSYRERGHPTSMEEDPEDFEPMAQYQGIYLINHILVEEHDASTGPAGRYQHSSQRTRRFQAMRDDDPSEAPRELAASELSAPKIKLLGSAEFLAAYATRVAESQNDNGTDRSAKAMRTVFDFVFFRARQVTPSTMEDLLRHVPGYSFQMKDLSRMVKNWQKSAQHAVVTT